MNALRKWGRQIRSKVSKAGNVTDANPSSIDDSDSDHAFDFMGPSHRRLNADIQGQRMIIEFPSHYPYPEEIAEAQHDSRLQALNGTPITWGQVQAREDRWELEKFQLGLRQGKTPRRGLCRVCRAINLLQGDKFSSRASIEFVPFGTSTQLACRAKHCAICRTVLEIATCNSSEVHPELAAIDMEVQGTQLNPEVIPSGEVVLGVDHGLRRVGAIRILNAENAMDILRQAYEHEIGNRTTAAESVFVDETGQKVSRDIIRKWLTEHGSKYKAEASSRTQELMNIMLIDVVDQKLVLASTAMKFFALSYVWGKVSMPRTLLSNVNARCKEKGLSEDIIEFPQVIKDAITLIHEIGERYLWVDAICIVQDDEAAKHLQIQRMDRIYAEAVATIVALAGDDANASLPGVRGGMRAPQTIHHVDGLSMVATPPPLHYVLDLSKWNTRAWTMQEKLLFPKMSFLF